MIACRPMQTLDPWVPSRVYTLPTPVTLSSRFSKIQGCDVMEILHVLFRSSLHVEIVKSSALRLAYQSNPRWSYDLVQKSVRGWPRYEASVARSADPKIRSRTPSCEFNLHLDQAEPRLVLTAGSVRYPVMWSE